MKVMKLVTCNNQFDSGLFINTQLQLGVGESPLCPNRFNGFCPPVEGVKLLKQFGDRRSANHPSEEEC